MHLDKYAYTANSQYTHFTFESVGPNGVIKKAVEYVRLSSLPTLGGNSAINIVFGDWDKENGLIDDTTVSNNKDKDKILATVASTIVTYIKKNEGWLPIHAIGRTPAKTRLYQMGINAHLPEIEKLFWVYGYKERKWMEFRSGINYEAFLGFKK